MKILITETQLDILLKEEAVLSAPLPGGLSVNSKFSKRRCLSGQKCRAHNGVDYKANSGTQALAISSGEVIKVKSDSGACGGTIVVKHDNGYKSSYCHMSNIKVSKGHRVEKGDVIGLTGGRRGQSGAGNSLGAHLHFGLKYKNGWVDPEQHIDNTNIMAGNLETARPEGVVVMRGDGLDGGSDDTVETVQALLVNRNYILPRFGVDGKFGPETEAAVNAFQNDHNIEVSGEVDEKTLDKLGDQANINKNPEINDPSLVKKNITGGEMSNWDPTVVDAIKKASIENNVELGLMMTIAQIESAGNPQAKNKRSGASGLYQIMPKYFASYGVTNTTVWDPYINATAGAKGLLRKINALRPIVGGQPTNAQIYMAHNQGSRGFSIIYNACNKFSNLGGKKSLQSSAVDLGYSKRQGTKIFKNMKGNKGNHPCQFMESWTDIYAVKSGQVPQLA
tara:strand:- start:1842 stop:3191 length:1350 start_codon:yes stop_codon:yes gene_type:complete